MFAADDSLDLVDIMPEIMEVIDQQSKIYQFDEVPLYFLAHTAATILAWH